MAFDFRQYVYMHTGREIVTEWGRGWVYETGRAIVGEGEWERALVWTTMGDVICGALGRTFGSWRTPGTSCSFPLPLFPTPLARSNVFCSARSCMFMSLLSTYIILSHKEQARLWLYRHAIFDFRLWILPFDFWLVVCAQLFPSSFWLDLSPFDVCLFDL